MDARDASAGRRSTSPARLGTFTPHTWADKELAFDVLWLALNKGVAMKLYKYVALTSVIGLLLTGVAQAQQGVPDKMGGTG